MADKIEAYFKNHNGILTTVELKNSGYHYKKIQKLLENGEIEQLRRGYYRIVNEDYYSDIPIITTLFPDAILCLQSALNYYDYIDRNPSSWHIAVKNTSTRTRFNIDCIQIKPHFITPAKYPIGITEAVIDGFNIKIYDRERTICDVLSYKNKIDAESYSQAIQSYLSDSKRNIAMLMKYASQLHVEKKAREVLSPWL